MMFEQTAHIVCDTNKGDLNGPVNHGVGSNVSVCGSCGKDNVKDSTTCAYCGKSM
ncbi:hypothetical protein R3P38DRAFT_2859476 [Favolaschia claudopus]|uniref:Zinc-ribbon domain-containing protein n=1 Tax=Favolaschia claudopus TaxID=2862362 RepID=A0AAW0DHL9_9AGAR